MDSAFIDQNIMILSLLDEVVNRGIIRRQFKEMIISSLRKTEMKYMILTLASREVLLEEFCEVSEMSSDDIRTKIWDKFFFVNSYDSDQLNRSFFELNSEAELFSNPSMLIYIHVALLDLVSF